GDTHLKLLDLGAGNGWLSYRLSRLGHYPAAVDLLVNSMDGLGAASHYLPHLPTPFPRFRAELENLPFEDEQFDCAIFNASFHYSEDYQRTLREAMRCVRHHGTVIIADTAWYSSELAGKRMIAERKAAFHKRFGYAPQELPRQEFLTDDRLERLERQLGVKWETHTPFYGLRWALRPVMARLRKQREPSKFRIYTAKVSHDSPF
ncbi:MAG: class I SAM-dependent methyltransferase, partial [Acidobacteriaceae bacterium]